MWYISQTVLFTLFTDCQCILHLVNYRGSMESRRRDHAIDIIKRLELVGFTSYEAKAYYALLQKYPVNGYEISKLSQVPPSKIYETLQKLMNRGAAIDSQTQPTLYSPVEPVTFFRRIQADAEKTITSLVEDLSNVSPPQSFQITWNLAGTTRINEKLTEIIATAAHSIYASVWPEQLDSIGPSLTTAMARGVYVVIATFGNCQTEAHEVYNLESCAANILARTKAKLCTVVTDDRDVVIGELAEQSEASKGIWTQTRSVVLVAKEYIKHDIMVGVLSDHIGEDKYRALVNQHSLWRT